MIPGISSTIQLITTFAGATFGGAAYIAFKLWRVRKPIVTFDAPSSHKDTMSSTAPLEQQMQTLSQAVQHFADVVTTSNQVSTHLVDIVGAQTRLLNCVYDDVRELKKRVCTPSPVHYASADHHHTDPHSIAAQGQSSHPVPPAPRADRSALQVNVAAFMESMKKLRSTEEGRAVLQALTTTTEEDGKEQDPVNCADNEDALEGPVGTVKAHGASADRDTCAAFVRHVDATVAQVSNMVTEIACLFGDVEGLTESGKVSRSRQLESARLRLVKELASGCERLQDAALLRRCACDH